MVRTVILCLFSHWKALSHRNQILNVTTKFSPSKFFRSDLWREFEPTYCIYHQETSHFSSDSEQTTNFVGSQEDKWLTADNSLIANSGSLHFNFAALPDFIPRWVLCFRVGFSFAILPFNAFSVIVLTGEHLAIKKPKEEQVVKEHNAPITTEEANTTEHRNTG